MRAFEWETKGVSRTLDPSAAAARVSERVWPFSGTDGLLHTDTGAPEAENPPSDVTEKGQAADRNPPPADSSDGAPV